MIDFHTHILPCVDDGSKSVAESIAMLREEAKQGIDTVVLTPHYYAHENSPLEFLRRRHKMMDRLGPELRRGLPAVYMGAEVQYFEGICDVEEVHYLRIQGTPYLMIEMPFMRWSDRVVEDVLALNEVPDQTVVLAHIERYMAYQPKDIWGELREQGILMQSNVSFFANWKTRRKAMTMLKNGQIDFLGSDCHNMATRRPNWDNLPEKARQTLQNGDSYRRMRACLIKPQQSKTPAPEMTEEDELLASWLM